MNLVDAIRLAAQKQLGAQSAESATPPSNPLDKGHSGNSLLEKEEVQTVRFEVRLTNQQLYDLLQWLSRTLHPVMTLREAAHYLRIRPNELQKLAEQGAIPAFKVDNRWRFLKQALDEWMMLQRATNLASAEENSHEENESVA